MGARSELSKRGGSVGEKRPSSVVEPKPGLDSILAHFAYPFFALARLWRTRDESIEAAALVLLALLVGDLGFFLVFIASRIATIPALPVGLPRTLIYIVGSIAVIPLILWMESRLRSNRVLARPEDTDRNPRRSAILGALILAGNVPLLMALGVLYVSVWGR